MIHWKYQVARFIKNLQDISKIYIRLYLNQLAFLKNQILYPYFYYLKTFASFFKLL